MALTRRQFIKTGIFGGVALAGAAWATKGTFWGKMSRRADAEGFAYRFLTRADYGAVKAIAPVVLATALPKDAQARAQKLEAVVQGFDVAVASFPPLVQKEIRELFSLLSIGLARGLATGVWGAWDQAGEGDIDAFLQKWHRSSLDLFRTAYDALQQLTLAAFYGNPDNWSAIGYPGPPKLGS